VPTQSHSIVLKNLLGDTLGKRCLLEHTGPRFVAAPGCNAITGSVYWAPWQSLWVTGHTLLAIVGCALSVSLENCLVFLICTAVTLCLGHSLGMHRLLIHRSYKTYRGIEYLFVWFGVLVGLAGPWGMMHTHDLRDWAQRQRDCHAYFGHKQRWWVDYWWQLHCKLQLQHPPEFVMEQEIKDDHFYRWLESTWMAQQLPVALILYVLGGWQWVVWGLCLRVSVSVFGHWCIGYFAHNCGGRSWHVEGAAVQGYNIPFCGLITMGECWHNNHHAFPGSAKLGLQGLQSDPGWWVLKTMSGCGLVWDIVLPKDLPHRPELATLPTRAR
jgi:stearoyl-CoA desaturase (delta-9 desaturase)